MLELKMGPASDGMGWMEFISSLVGSLAWPVAAVVIALVFHKQIAGLLAKVKTLKWGEAAVELSDQLDKVEDKARIVAAEEPIVPQPLPLPDERFQALLAISPAAAILDAWAPVAKKVLALARAAYGNETKYLTAGKAAEKLAKDNMLKPTTVSMILDLQKIRNEAAHHRDVSATDALRFYDFAKAVTSVLSTSD